MKYLLNLFFVGLFFASCTCDEGYCSSIDNITINIEYSDDFYLSELRNSKLVVIDTVRQLAIDSFNLISANSTYRNTSIEYYEELPSRNNIFVLNFNDFSDTIRNLYYETNQTTYKCKTGCYPNLSIGNNTDYTEVTDFFFTHKGDTIRDNTVFIEK